MKLCDYGCGQEAKHQLKNGKWCCSKSQNSCPVSCKKRSIRIKEIRKDPNSKYNSNKYKKKQSKLMIESWKDPNSKFNSIEYKENQSNIMKEMWKDLEYKEKQINTIKEIHKDPNSKYNSISCNEKRSVKMKELRKDPNSIFNSIECKEKQSKSRKLDIEKINKRYPFFFKIEKMRYNPDKPGEKEIQVHCKNYECEHSKEKGGWFTPTGNQVSDRIRALESKDGNGGSYFYCCQECKDTCPLYNLKGDPYKNTNLPYTYAEYLTCRAVVFERENTLCEYCGEPATHMHHIFPVKIAPFFALDPDYCVACCEKHHYKYGHKDECSTGNLAKIVCSVESQKFLNQTLEDI